MFKLITFFALVAVTYATPGYLGAGLAAPVAYAAPAAIAAAPVAYAAPAIVAAPLSYAAPPLSYAAAPLGYAAAPAIGIGYGGIVKSHHGIIG